MAHPKKAHVVHVGSAHLDLTAPPRPDGYRPIADSLFTFAAIGGRPPEVQARWLLNAAQKCDAAHLQFLRLRKELDEIEVRLGEPGGASPPVRRKIHEAIGDAQLAVTALYGSIGLVRRLGQSGLRAKMPKDIARVEATVKKLRAVYEHPWQVLREVSDEAARSPGLDALGSTRCSVTVNLGVRTVSQR